MDLAAAYQQYIPWLEPVSFAFYKISNLTRNENYYFVKVMVVKLKLQALFVFKVKEFEIIVKIAPLVPQEIVLLFHKAPLMITRFQNGILGLQTGSSRFN
jgi:hypothetical protein